MGKKYTGVTKEELKTQYPDVCEEFLMEGITAERARIVELMERKRYPRYQSMPEVLKIFDRVILDGTSIDAARLLITDAVKEAIKKDQE